MSKLKESDKIAKLIPIYQLKGKNMLLRNPYGCKVSTLVRALVVIFCDTCWVS